MSALSMTQEEREAFLADLHVGVISIDQPGHPPLCVPIWYDYEPARGLWVLTEEDSLKSQLLKAAGRFSLVAQVETAPLYQYVSVEGPVVDVRPADREKDARPMARRYFGQEGGDLYVDGDSSNTSNLVFTMRPERWRTVDYRKLQAGG